MPPDRKSAMSTAATDERSRFSASGIDTTFLFFICVWSIFNSHLEAFYPYPWLAADGLLANSLFFLLSGFGIQFSLMRGRAPFGAYFLRRVVRIYPALVLVTLLAAAAGLYAMNGIGEAFSMLVWPTPYTYVALIMPFYVVLYFLDLGGPRALAASLCAGAALFSAGYILSWDGLGAGRLSIGLLPWPIHAGFFWIATASGAMLARMRASSSATLPRVLGLLILVAAYLAVKFWLVVGGGPAALYPALYLLCLAICILSVRTLCRPEFVTSVLRIPFLGAFCALSASLTLEIYLVHPPLLRIQALAAIPFPLNILTVAALSLAGAFLLARLVAQATRGAARLPEFARR